MSICHGWEDAVCRCLTTCQQAGWRLPAFHAGGTDTVPLVRDCTGFGYHWPQPDPWPKLWVCAGPSAAALASRSTCLFKLPLCCSKPAHEVQTITVVWTTGQLSRALPQMKS